jgi:hypothetical protein
MPKTTPVHPDLHSKLKVKEQIDFNELAQQQFSALTAQEFAQAASSYPIVMLKDGQSGMFVSVALWGIEAGQNLFFNTGSKHWDAVHLPNEMQCQPFSIGPAVGENNTLTMHINETSELVQENEGRSLFDSEGESAFLKSMQAKLADHYQHQLFTKEFINLMLEKQLLKELELMVAFQDGKVKRIKGLYTIDEEALSKLDQDTILSFFKRNLFIPIYAMLGSLTQFNRLMKLNNQDHELPKIARLQMRTPDSEQ